MKEMRHCGFDEIEFSFTTNVKEAFTNAKYIVSSGGAPRKIKMTREELLRGNAQIAAQLGKDVKTYCPDLKHLSVIFNPTDNYRADSIDSLGIETFATDHSCRS